MDSAADPGDLAQIVYTSGTTGRAKGVAASHANLCHGHVSRPRRRRFAHSETLLHAFPIGTNGAQTMLLYALTAHPTILAMPTFDSDGFGALVEAHRVGSVFVVPSMAIDLLTTGVPNRHDLSSVLLFSSSAAALPPAVAATLARALPGATIVNCYTSTEAAPAETMMVVDPARPGSVLVTGEDGTPLPPGQVGDVWLRCPAAPRAYFGDPAATAATFRAGRVRMGDLGYLDEDGYLFLVDRDADVVESGGRKVSTLQVEAALYEHPAVAEAAAVGVAHRVLGHAVAAAVVARAPVTPRELREFLSGRLAPYQVPSRVAIVDALPHNASGKVVKREVRELLAARPDGCAAPLRTPTEVALGRLWAQVLEVPEVGADSPSRPPGSPRWRPRRSAWRWASRSSSTRQCLPSRPPGSKRRRRRRGPGVGPTVDRSARRRSTSCGGSRRYRAGGCNRSAWRCASATRSTWQPSNGR